MVTTIRKMPQHTILAGLLLLAACLAAGCSHLSVAHLEGKPWRAGQSQVVTMKYWRFTFIAYLDGESYGVRGLATPVPAILPPWADRLENLTITAYLRDSSGRVLAQAEKTYPGIRLTPNAAIPFAFTLSPDPIAAACDLSVSFGYKALYGSSTARATLPQGPPPTGTVFFASEGAVLQ